PLPTTVMPPELSRAPEVTCAFAAARPARSFTGRPRSCVKNKGLGQAAQELFDAFAVGAGVGEVRHDVVGAGDDPQVGVRLGGVEFVGHGGGVVAVGS